MMVNRALAKSGVRVLHVDENDFYGSSTATLNLMNILKWFLSARHGVSTHKLQLFDHSSSTNVQFRCNSDHHLAPTLKFNEENLHHLTNFLKEGTDFGIDLSVCMLFNDGPHVDALIRSGAAKYLEFNAVNGLQVLDSALGELMPVPFNKSAVFQSSQLALLEKRQLMRFFTSVPLMPPAIHKIGSVDTITNIESSGNTDKKDSSAQPYMFGEAYRSQQQNYNVQTAAPRNWNDNWHEFLRENNRLSNKVAEVV
eukprot:Filipodium_phascolosomae@DN8118_c0_g1_i1.p1